MKNKWLLIGILILAAALRLYQLGAIPVSLNRDEASIGYTAYSLLKTGADEYGRSWPVNIESFGDWKLPGYEWFAMPVIAVFGLSPWSVRLPAAIAGVLSVYLMYRLVLLVAENKKSSQAHALFAAFLLAVVPWHVHLTRMAYEASIALALLLGGLVLLMTAVKEHSRWRFFVSAAFFGLTFFTYHSFQLVTPLLIFVTLSMNKANYLKFSKSVWRDWFLWFVVLLTPIVVLYSGGLLGATKTKFSGLSIFDPPAYFSRLVEKRALVSDYPALVGKLYSSIPLEITRQFTANLFAAVSADFLFFNGGGHGSHDIAGMGKLYTFMAPLIFLGLGGLWRKKSLFGQKTLLWISAWLLIGILPAAITWEPAHSTRAFAAVIPLIVFATEGLFQASVLLKNHSLVRSLVTISFSALVLYQIASMCFLYFVVAPRRDIDNWAWITPQMTSEIEGVASQVNHVYVDGNTWSPYIFYLFFTEYDPQMAQEKLTHLPPDIEGFQHVTQLDNIEFGTIEFQSIMNQADSFAIFAPVSVVPDTIKNAASEFDEYQVITHDFSQKSYLFAVMK